MCSRYFLKTMESNYQGDLTDIIRASGGNTPLGAPTAAAAAAAATSAPQWQFPTNSASYPTCPVDDFGDPFAHLRDPLLHGGIGTPPPPLPGFFHAIKPGVDGAGAFVGNDEMKRPPNIFSRMLQISPTPKLPLSPCDTAASPTGLKGGGGGGGGAPILVPNDHTLISPSNSKGCLVESSLQIPSPRNAGIRRRKSQAKKVVCIPAPAPAGSRPSGEVVPSDLWAWRKYGQKPIKGSPFPRGYYRCSSSKGCSARKQVERSRTDPNMLVITYTSEHNHPWPTQRNALAGSTRSQPSKTTAAAGGGGKTSPSSLKSTNPKEEQKDIISTDHAAPSQKQNPAAVKEEAYQEFDSSNNKEMEMGDDADFEDDFSQSYKPVMPESNHSEDSFFADLGEIEADSLDLLFTQGFDDRVDGKGLDSFTFYDWATGSGNTNATAASAAAGSGATTAHGESERDS